MVRLLVNQGQVQKLLVINESGEYSDKQSVVWDERVDGEFPKDLLSKVGGLVRSGSSLVVDQTKLDAFTAAKAQQDATIAAKKARVDQAINVIQNIDLSGTLTAGQLQTLIKALITIVRYN